MRPSVIFLAFYFSDLEKIKKIIKKETDLVFNIPIPQSGAYDHWAPVKEIQMTAGELVQMILDAWFDRRALPYISGYPEIHPEEIFQQTKLVKKWLRSFSNSIPKRVNYGKYYKLIYYLNEEWNWIDEDEMQEYIKRGYRKIDLDLINFSQKRKKEKVKELLETGANPDIDPDDESATSEVLEILAAKSSFQFTTFYLPGFETYRLKGVPGFIGETEYNMISSLYGVASSEVLRRTILPFSKLAPE